MCARLVGSAHYYTLCYLAYRVILRALVLITDDKGMSSPVAVQNMRNKGVLMPRKESLL